MERKRIGRRRGKTDEVHLNSEEFMYHVNSLVIKPSMAPSKEPYNFMFHKWPSVISNQDLRVQVNKIAHSQQIKSRPQLNGKQGLVWFGLVKTPLTTKKKFIQINGLARTKCD